MRNGLLLFFCPLHCLDLILYPFSSEILIFDIKIFKNLEAKQKTTYLASFPSVSFFQGILSELLATDPNDHIFTLVDDMVEPSKNSVNVGSCDELLACDEGERSVASVEDQLHKEMIVYEVCNVNILDLLPILHLLLGYLNMIQNPHMQQLYLT